jgi:hypothetical protein
MSPPSTIPLRHEVAAIIALDAQPALRNLRITQCYHDLSQSIASVIGDADVNWCTFASWASKTAGRFVRGELVGIFRDALQSDRRLADKLDRINQLSRRVDAAARLSQLGIFEVLKAPIMEVSRYITAGNLAVFAELGPLFSAMCEHMGRDAAYDPGSLAHVLDELKLKAGRPEEGGQSLLRSAVSHFYQARFTADPDRKAELILLANAQTGLHEQVRLQPAIAGSLQLPSDAALRALLDGVFAGKAFEDARMRLRVALEVTAKPLFAEVDRELNRIWRECATRIFMTLRLPEGEIHLGQDLRKSPGHELFPSGLQSIEMNDLRTLLATYRADGSTAEESGAADWAEIPERMHFILTLFRARQQDQRLFEQPFTDAQSSDIAAGRMPAGAL